MRGAAMRLPAPPAGGGKLSSPIYFLTGRRFWQQTLFCAHSFVQHGGAADELRFASDGTMDDEIARRLTRLFPSAQVLGHKELDEKFAAALPPGRFPTLHAHRRRFVLLHKLTDTLAGERGYRLFLDSDMIFWHRPDELLARLARAEPFYMADLGDDGYTLPRRVLQEKLGIVPAPGVNSGVVAAQPEAIDWDRLERACAFLLAEGRDQRLLEQTLWALALGPQNARPLPAADYRLAIDPPACRKIIAAGRPALLHYAWHARLLYVADEWRYYLSGLEASLP